MYCICIIAKLRQQCLQMVEDCTASLISLVVKSECFLNPDPKLDVVDCLDKSIAVFPAYIAAHIFSQSMLEYAHIEASVNVQLYV